jgi:hypothetical protein
MGQKRKHIGYWWKSQKERDPQGRPSRKWVDNIKMDLREIEGVVWTGLMWLRDRDH